MSYQSVRLLLQDVAKSLADNIQFAAGRHSEFNMKKSVSYPWIWLLPITASPRFAVNDVEHFEKTWNIALLFFDKDAFDAKEGPSNDILDAQDQTVDKFIIRLNDWSMKLEDTVGAITLRGFNQQPFYKDDAGIHTGWLLTFSMTVPDSFEYCTPDNIAIYAADN
jgi:hypothetical protein